MNSINLKDQILTYNKYTVLTMSQAVLSVLSPKKLFSALRSSVLSRNKAGGGGGGGGSPGSTTASNANVFLYR